MNRFWILRSSVTAFLRGTPDVHHRSGYRSEVLPDLVVDLDLAGRLQYLYCLLLLGQHAIHHRLCTKRIVRSAAAVLTAAASAALAAAARPVALMITAALLLAAAHATRATPTARTTCMAVVALAALAALGLAPTAPSLAARVPRINQTAFIMVVETEILIHASHYCTSLSSGGVCSQRCWREMTTMTRAIAV